jgi:FkbM family methyltransferase
VTSTLVSNPVDRAVIALGRSVMLRQLGHAGYPRRGAQWPIRLLQILPTRRSFQSPGLPPIDPRQLPQPRRFEMAWLYHWQRHPHDVLARLIRVFAHPGAVAVDVGVYLGWYTYLLAGQVGLTGRVHCFEPDPALRPLLEALVGALTPVQAHFVGAGDQPATLPFYQGPASQSSFVPPAGGGQQVDVPVRRIDEELGEDAGRVNFLKLDVEGYEHQALRGMDKLLAATTRPVIFLEMSEMLQAAAQGRSSAVLDHLWDHQYQMFMAPTLTWRAAVPLKPLDHPERAADGWMDALAVPAERMGELVGAVRDGTVALVDAY